MLVIGLLNSSNVIEETKMVYPRSVVGAGGLKWSPTGFAQHGVGGNVVVW
jgi:hypothetical protein